MAAGRAGMLANLPGRPVQDRTRSLTSLQEGRVASVATGRRRSAKVASILAWALLIARAASAETNDSFAICNHAATLLRQSHPPGHIRVRDFDSSKLDAVFDAYSKCRDTYKTDSFVLFFAAQGMGFVAELNGTRAYAYASAFVDTGAQKLRAMAKAAQFYRFERRYAIQMLTDALKFDEDARALYNPDDSRFWNIGDQLSRATSADT